MSAISVKELSRAFNTYKKQPGFAGAVRGLFHREYETTLAVQKISFEIEEGELVGFLGPNGAGKTTTLKMLAGLLHPTSGDANVLGYRPWERVDGYRRQFALILGQKNQLWWDLPARESLELNARIYGIDDASRQKITDEMTELLQVRDKLDVMVRELSLGERMKMELVASLLHQPRVLFLDEPTIGLDVISQKTVRDFLKHHNKTRRTTIILTSHYMADIQELCRRVLIIDHGKLFFDGPLDDVVDRFANSKVITIQVADAQPIPESLWKPLGEKLDTAEGSLRLKVPRQQVIPACKTLMDQLDIRDIDIQEVPIEDVIRDLFARQSAPSSDPS